MKNRGGLFLGITILILTAVSCGRAVDAGHGADRLLILAGSYAEDGEAGVRLLSFNRLSGSVELLDDCNAGSNPSYLWQASSSERIYAVNERGEGKGRVTSLILDTANMKLSVSGEIEISGEGPCHISGTPGGEELYVSSYGDGSLSVIVTGEEGKPEYESAYFRYHSGDGSTSHAHMARLYSRERRLAVSDLGLDRVMIYSMDEKGGSPVPIEEGYITVQPGSGPRHFCFDSREQYIYVLNELSSDISMFRQGLNGSFTHIYTCSTLPDGYKGENYCSGILLSPDGKYLYAGNRGHNSIAVFAIGQAGRPEFKGTVDCGGDWPRSLSLDPSGRIMSVANQRSGNISFFTLDTTTGMPEPIGEGYAMKSPAVTLFINFEL